ncbi:N-(5'-phosphoribosyl)anthranilate isomerase [Pacificoceanicola onchidii]|uniref:N-(5'-phosphoribosyl)anthranilate isomerase n=1 Tax=Pacificoceanicola onchidii TaxID=2562685 RepID=UPI0010A4E409|nr:N-(5'-phosphoribosyl)anthranilate isomerase [Pacificoceanicola onchidii]
MTRIPDHLRPEDWIRTIFSARAAAEGGVIRRKTRDIERIVGRDRFAHELARRGFSAIENGGQTVIFCNREPVRFWSLPEPEAQIPSMEFAKPVDGF